MTIYKAYKFRLNPTTNQKNKLNQFLGTSRFIYNHFLNKKDEKYKQGNNYYLKDMCKDLVPLQSEYPWLSSVDSCALRTALFDLDDAYTRFFNKQNEHPRYKKKTYINSYRTNCIRSSYKGNNYSNIEVDLKDKTIKLPKLGKVSIRGYRNLKNFEDKRIINATVSNVAGKYYVSVCVEEDIPYSEYVLKSAIGLDLGVKNLVITSDGIKYKSMQSIKRLEYKIKGLNKALSRSQRCSKNRYKIILKIQRVNLKIRNIRKYYTHLITSQLVRKNDLIVTENLNVKNMIENASTKSLTKSLTNSTLSEIIRQLKYKSECYNKKLVQVDRYYKSSQICSCCGYINGLVKDLSIRRYVCNKCNNELDRDINASINILYEGINKYFKEQYSN